MKTFTKIIMNKTVFQPKADYPHVCS